jgi:hypothetical protein
MLHTLASYVFIVVHFLSSLLDGNSIARQQPSRDNNTKDSNTTSRQERLTVKAGVIRLESTGNTSAVLDPLSMVMFIIPF